ncbi:MAG: hypothetical protein HXS44_17860 [Theionarchaea archaeon]|nr:hypothetical protein [Theionarchaea archaeon]
MKTKSRIAGFIVFWFAFICVLALLFIQFYIGIIVIHFFAIMVIGIIVMINGLYMMSGSKFTLSLEFWKEKFGGGYPLWFGAIFEFYIDIIVIIILCIVIVIYAAPLLIQRLFVLLIGTTLVCLLFYFRLKDRRTLD